MDSKINNIFKLISINLIFFFIFIIFIELIFGYWFEKYNFGPYLREHRLKKIPYQMTYGNIKYNYEYIKNSYAFRGQELNPKDIKIIMVGGSTTDERYKPEKFTIVEILNKKLNEQNFSKKIINAGIEGQSTRGHVANFNYWFNKIENFKPEFMIFYIGINDSIFLNSNNSDLQDGWIKNPNKFESFLDNIKSRSILANLIKKIKHKYNMKDESKRLIYDYDYHMKNNKEKKIYINYNDKFDMYDLNISLKSNKIIIDKYIQNIDRLYNLTKSLGAVPIFINQPAQQGHFSEILFVLNNSLILHCKKKEYNCIDLVKELEATNDFWWDGIHTTPKGSRAIADKIFPKLIKFLN